MSNSYFAVTLLTRNTLARAEDINSISQALEAAFDKLPAPHASAPTTKGFSETFLIVDGSNLAHPITVRQVRVQSTIYGADSGSSNAYAVTLTPAPTAYTEGMRVVMKASSTNSGAATINVNALGAKGIRKFGGSALTGSEIRSGAVVSMTYDGTYFQLDSWASDTMLQILDEDDMASDSPSAAPSQQSVGVFVGNQIAGTKLDDLSAPDDNTDLDASISAHGLLSKLDKVKLDGIEAAADVTDATNVAAAGALMLSTVTTKGDLLAATGAAAVARLGIGTDGQSLVADALETPGVKWKTLTQDDVGNGSTYVRTTNDFTTAEKSKLGGIETSADVTDATNVAAAGAVMASTVDAKGDLLVGTADNTVGRLAAGTNGYVLVADSAETPGMKWAAIVSGVSSVNTATGAVTLTQDNIGDGATYKQYSSTEKTKLSGIETAADVTDATNVDAAGATMNADTTLAGNGYFLDEDNMASNSATKVASQQSIKAYADTMLPKAGGTMSGEINCADQLLTRPYLKDTAEVIQDLGNLSGAETVDLTSGNVAYGTVTGATTFTFSNPPATGRAGYLTLILYDGGDYTITWPGAVDWDGGSAPELNSNGWDIIVFVTYDAGTTWRGARAWKEA
jgi:hypothetical protein